MQRWRDDDKIVNVSLSLRVDEEDFSASCSVNPINALVGVILQLCTYACAECIQRNPRVMRESLKPFILSLCCVVLPVYHFVLGTSPLWTGTDRALQKVHKKPNNNAGKCPRKSR